MTREKKIAKAAALRAEGLSYPEIAKRLGVSRGAVWKWLNPEATIEFTRRDNAKRASYKAQWADENARGECQDCGRPLCVGSRYKGWTRCETCHAAEAGRKRELIAEGYRAGLTAWQIAEQTGIPRDSVIAEAHRMRLRGVDVPYGVTGGAAHRVRVAA